MIKHISLLNKLYTPLQLNESKNDEWYGKDQAFFDRNTVRAQQMKNELIDHTRRDWIVCGVGLFPEFHR